MNNLRAVSSRFVYKVLMIVALSAFVLVAFRNRILFRHNFGQVIPSSRDAVHPPFDFVPAEPKSLSDCDQLFGPDTAAAAFQMSSEYHAAFPAFAAAVNQSIVNEAVEGFTFGLPTQFKVLHYLASRPNVRSICETGFNLGHSSFNYLTASRHAVVHSFDLGTHNYADKMAQFMRRHFPNRFFVHFGDSTKTVPQFGRAHPDHRCDFIFVDGGHTYPVAVADLLNLAAMADVDAGNVIMLDDYPSLLAGNMFPQPIGWAWENMRRWGYVRELLRCSFESKQFKRGFVIGTVVRRPKLLS